MNARGIVDWEVKEEALVNDTIDSCIDASRRLTPYDDVNGDDRVNKKLRPAISTLLE